MFAAKYDSSGECIGVKHVGNTDGWGIVADANNHCYIPGTFKDTAVFGSTQLINTTPLLNNLFWAKLDQILSVENTIGANNMLMIYANPNQGKCSITVPEEFNNEKKLVLSIYDNTGKVIQQGSLDMSEDKVRINISAEGKGIYNVTLTNGKKIFSGKIVFE